MSDLVTTTPNIRLPRPTPDAADDIDDLLQSWLQSLTDDTVRTYQLDLEYFTGWLGADSIGHAMLALFSLTSPRANALVLRYRQHLQTTPIVFRGEERSGYSAAVVNRRLSAIRSIAKIARITGRFDGTIEIPGVASAAVIDTRGIGPKAYHAMMARLDVLERRKGIPDRRRWEIARDRAMLRLLHDMMLRRAEVQRMSLEDLELDAEEPAIVIHPKGPKGVTERLLVPDRIAEALQQWLVVRGDHAGALFHAYGEPAKGRPLDPSTINRICGRRGIQAKLKRKCRPHGLRHTAITTGLDITGGDLRSVAQAARHKNPSTTLRYDDKAKRNRRNLSDLIGSKE